MTSDFSPAESGDPQRYPFGPNERLDLHPSFRRIQEQKPLCRVRLPYGEPAWLVTRYADAAAVLSDPRFSREQALHHDQPRMIPDLFPLGLLDMDPPKHSRIRRLMAKAFTMRGAERLRPSAHRLATELIKAMIDAGPPAELVHDFAVPMPFAVICELLGVPYEERGEFAQWVSDATSAQASREQRAEGLRKQTEYMTDLVAKRRREPTDDLLGALVLARDEGDRLTEDELVPLSFGLLAAGFETTSKEIANFVYLLLTHPDQFALLREHPQGHLAFGHGAHHCVGAQLARMELQVALGELISRLPGLRLAIDADEVPWQPSVLVRGPAALPVTW